MFPKYQGIIQKLFFLSSGADKKDRTFLFLRSVRSFPYEMLFLSILIRSFIRLALSVLLVAVT